MGRLHTGEAAGTAASFPLLGQGQVIEFTACVGTVSHLLVLPKDANAPADGDGRALIVTSDHDHTDPGVTTQLDGAHDLLAGWVQHAHDAHECQVRLQEWGFRAEGGGLESVLGNRAWARSWWGGGDYFDG